ncbi:MAG TPA: SPASM domain-containing protein [Phycisphaerae bacterium]|nr:SPASM domain-containing protein [Phycisphaerae bacterium]
MTEQVLHLPVVQDHVTRLKTLLEQRPLYLSIETTNICNARCVFCAYPKMQRHKAVMTAELFEKIISDYVNMGGGAVGLTPIVGDVLVDPLFLDRLRLLRAQPSITHVSFVTNGIAWHRFSADDQRFIMQNIDSISISIGGLDAPSYKGMFAVDRYENVRAAVHRMCDLKAQYSIAVDIHMGFRVNRAIDELLTDPKMDQFRRPEVTSISAINNFANWGGLVGRDDLPPGAHLVQMDESPGQVRRLKRNPCFVYYSHPEVSVSGLVSACACMNAEADALILGDTSRQHLRDIWQNPKRKELRASFGTDSLPDICRNCTYYDDGEAFIRQPAFRHFEVGLNPWDVLRQHAPLAAHAALERTLTELVQEGYRRMGLYGAGAFTRSAVVSPEFDLHAFPVVVVIDDNPALQGTCIAELPIVSCREALDRRIDAVVLATDRYTAQMWEGAGPLREAGVHVRPINTLRAAPT